MSLKLQVTLDFMHLENALFCAEQSISSGIDSLEAGSLLLKNAGLNSIRILKSRFPNVPILLDIKASKGYEVDSVAGVGASGVTISGAISEVNWESCVQKAKEHSLDVFLDFRGMSWSVIRDRSHLAIGADCIIMDFDEKESEASFTMLHETMSLLAKPLAITGIVKEENISRAILCGASTLLLTFHDQESQNVKEKVGELRNTLAKVGENCTVDAVQECNEKILFEKLGKISPSQVCEVYCRPAYLDRVYPLHRFTKILGKAYTIKVWPGSQKAIASFLMEVPSGTIVVIDSGGHGPAVWDAITTEIAIKQKLTGVLVYGAVTDVNVLRNRGFPCYTTNITAVPGTENCTPIKNMPLHIGDVIVRPGDWLIGDDSGIVCIPADKAFSIADNAFRLAQYKTKIVDSLQTASDAKEMQKVLDQYTNNFNKFSVE